MELTKRSNFTLDLTNVGGATPVVIKKGLKAIDFVGAIATTEDPSTGKGFSVITACIDALDGTVIVVTGPVNYKYDPATGQITVVSDGGNPGTT